MKKTNIIERKFLPTQLDEAPYGTVCKIIDNSAIFLQVNKDSINWIPLSLVLIEVYKNKLDDKLFVANIVQQYNENILNS